jgi:hypothetical protein
LNPPCGGSRGIDGCQRFLLARSVASGVGGTRPPRLSPGGETGKGEIRLPCCRRRFALAWRWQARRWLSVCARSTTFLSVTITNLLCRSARSAFQKSCRRHPLLCRASIRTLHGPAMGPVQVGSDLRPRPITTVTNLGCWVLPSCGRSLKDQSYQTQSPEQGGGCLCLPKLLDVCRPPRHQLMLVLLLILYPCGCSEWSALATGSPASSLAGYAASPTSAVGAPWRNGS